MDNPQIKTGKGSILIVDDDLSARQTLSALMEGEGYEVRCAPSGSTALMFAHEEPPEVILLDVRLPDVDGFEVCRRLKENTGTCGTPVIFLSALEEATDKVKGFEAGGADYITKPFHAEEVLARVRTHVALYRLQSGLQRRVEAGTLRVANAQLAQSIDALNRSEGTLKERLQFETLLTDLSVQFVSVPADQVDRKIEDAQRRVCELLGLDLSALWQWSVETPGAITLTHLVSSPGWSAATRADERSRVFPLVPAAGPGRQESLPFPLLRTLPAEAARDQEVWRYYGIKTTLTFPLSAGGRADLWCHILQYDAGGTHLAGGDRQPASTGRADIRQCPCPETRRTRRCARARLA